MTTTEETATPISIDVLKTALESGPVEVTFIKVNGESTTRKMTRCLSIIPTENHPTSDRAATPGVTPAFDLEKGEWRSFRNDSVTRWIRI